MNTSCASQLIKIQTSTSGIVQAIEINIESGTVDPMRVSFNFSWAEIIYYHPRMRVGNVFGHVCLSVFLSVQAITFEPLDIETYFWYGGTS